MKRQWIVGLALILAMVAVPAVEACLEVPPDPPDIWVSGDPCVEDLLVVLHDYTTFASGPGNSCGCALNLPLTFGVVVGAEIVYAGTDIPLPGFPFVSNPAVGDGFDALEPGDWEGFSANVDAVVGAGEDVDLRFRVQARKPQLCEFVSEEVVTVLESQEFVAGTAKVDDDGTPIEHIGIVKPGVVMATGLGGDVRDITMKGFRCTNQATGQVVQMLVSPDEKMFDCTALGLETEVGDSVLITILGDAE